MCNVFSKTGSPAPTTGNIQYPKSQETPRSLRGTTQTGVKVSQALFLPVRRTKQELSSCLCCSMLLTGVMTIVRSARIVTLLSARLTLLKPRSRFGDKPLKFQVVCPRNGTAGLKGLKKVDPKQSISMGSAQQSIPFGQRFLRDSSLVSGARGDISWPPLHHHVIPGTTTRKSTDRILLYPHQ